MFYTQHQILKHDFVVYNVFLKTCDYLNLTKECNCMKGIKIGIVGVCVSLVGIAFAMNNFIAISAAFVGLLLSIVGCFIKDK